MTHIVTDNCVKCKYTDCVAVCPVDCFYEGPNFMVIDPDACIDCTLCVQECPAGAIYNEYNIPQDQAHYKQLNANIVRFMNWKNSTQKQSALPDAKEWDGVPNKLKYLKF